jgi:hypothetical protein
MDVLLDWLYSGDEDIFNKATLEAKSKDMLAVGSVIYSRMNNWNKLEENITLLEKAIDKITNASKVEWDKLQSKQQTYLTKDDFEAINQLLQAKLAKVDEFKKKVGEGVRTAEPLVKPEVVEEEKEELKKKVKKVYMDAEFKVKEEERKRKEEEERKKKEEEERKRKEEEEKKKKEEEEKKKKEGDDVVMKDENAQGGESSNSNNTTNASEPKKENNNDAMDVE